MSDGFLDGHCSWCGTREDQFHRAGCMNLGPGEAFAEGLKIARQSIDRLPKTREVALVVTKLDEAELWFTRIQKP